MYAFSAKGALLRSAWGNAPGIMDQEGLSAESAYHERHESRHQRSPIIPIQFPGATPQVRHGESVLWRTEIESALSALNTSAVTDCRYSSYRTVSNSKAAAFSLVEVVLALGVAAFCLIAILGLMPVGVQTNRSATSQTAAANIMAAIVADLRTTPAAATTSPEFAITFGTEKTLFFDASGQAATSLSSDSRYRLNVTWNSAPTGLQYAVLKVTWPASVDPATATPSGSVKIFAAFDRS
jgi:uncharacterized protein (TIGR02598 family)